MSKKLKSVRIKEVALVSSSHPASPLLSPSLPLFLSLGLSCSGTARGADGPSVIQRGMFHVHLAQAQIPPAGKLFSGQPPVIRGLESTAQHNIALSLCFLGGGGFHHHSMSFLFITTTDIHIYLSMNLFTSLYLLVDKVL